MHFQNIEKSVHQILSEIPAHIELVAAAKTRSAEEVRAAVEAGVRIIGYNYVQEAERIRPHIPYTVGWHMIGHLQRNKLRRTLPLLDLLHSLDSPRLAAAITADLAGSVAAPTIKGTRSIAADAAMPVTELPEVVIIGRREDA